LSLDEQGYFVYQIRTGPQALWRLRTTIREIVVQTNDVSAKIELVIHWAGGVHTRLEVPKNRYGRNKNAAAEETVELVRQLARGWPDRYIAQILNRIGSRTGPGNSWSETRVRMFRNQHGIQVFSVGSERPWLTIEEVASQLGVSVAVVRTMVRNGKLPARQITRGVPWMIERHDLARPEVVARVRDAKLGRKSPHEDARQITMHCI
jgi:excisionase family DNA binding protein